MRERVLEPKRWQVGAPWSRAGPRRGRCPARRSHGRERWWRPDARRWWRGQGQSDRRQARRWPARAAKAAAEETSSHARAKERTWLRATRRAKDDASDSSTHLHRGDGALSGGGNALLKTTEISRQRRLVAHSGGDAAQQGGHLVNTQASRRVSIFIAEGVRALARDEIPREVSRRLVGGVE